MNDSPLNFQIGRRESLLITTVILGIAFVYQMFWLSKRRAEITDARGRLAVIEQGLREDASMETQLQTRAPAEAPEEPTTPAGSIPFIIEKNQRYANLIRELSYSGAADEQFRLKKIVVDEEAKESGYTRLRMTLEVDGSFFSIAKFLERLEKSPLLTEVLSIDIYRMEKELRKCSARINLNGFLVGS